jgi:hypothetical protein
MPGSSPTKDNKRADDPQVVRDVPRQPSAMSCDLAFVETMGLVPTTPWLHTRTARTLSDQYFCSSAASENLEIIR